MKIRKEIKTIKGYLSAVKRLEKNSIACLKDFDNLTEKEQEILYAISAGLGNLLGEFTEENREVNKNG